MPLFNTIVPSKDNDFTTTLAAVEAVAEDDQNGAHERRAARYFAEYLRRNGCSADLKLLHEDGLDEYVKRTMLARYKFGDEEILVKAVNWEAVADGFAQGRPDLYYMSDGEDDKFDGTWWLI